MWTPEGCTATNRPLQTSRHSSSDFPRVQAACGGRPNHVASVHGGCGDRGRKGLRVPACESDDEDPGDDAFFS